MKIFVIYYEVCKIEESKTIAEQAETVGKVFDTLAGSKGEISDLLNDYAKRLDNARGKEKDGIKQAFLERLREAVPRIIRGGERGGLEGSRPDAEGRVDKDTGGLKEPSLSQETIKTLLSFPKDMQVYPFGPSNAEFRQRILFELTGTKPPKSKAGAEAVRDAITEAAGISKKGKAIVEWEREAITWLEGQVREPLDLFGQPEPGQQELFNIPKGEVAKKEKPEKKIKAPPREAQLDLFTGQQNNQIQKGLFDTFPKGRKPSFRAATPAEQGALSANQRTRMATTGTLRSSGVVAKTPAQIASILSPIRKSAQELAYAVATDKDGVILQIHKYSKGTKEGINVHPIEVAIPAMNIPEVDTVYFVHHHPSGAGKASPEDVEITIMISNLLKLKGINLRSFIIHGTKWSGIEW